MPEQRRSGYRRGESCEVGDNVIDGSDEIPVGHMCDGNEEAASEGDGEEQADHAAKYRVNPLAQDVSPAA